MDMASLLGQMSQQQPDPETIARIQLFNQAVSDAAEEARRRLVTHGWLFCSCRRYWDRDDPAMPPQAHCPVHGSVMVLDSTGEVI